MSSFTTPLILEYVDGSTWIVNREFVYYTNYHVGGRDCGLEIIVPAGFPTDFASIPRIFWRVLPPTGIYGKAAVIHDFLYKTQGGSREWADSVFLEAMDVLEVPAWKKFVMHKAVRMCGWKAWNDHAEKNKT